MKANELEQHGVKTVRFYFEKSSILPNIYTVCIFIDENNQIISRGISLCSVLDQHVKSEGKKRSKDRAIKALMEKKTQLPINDKRVKYFVVTRSFKFKENEQDCIKNIIDESCSSQLVSWTSSDGKRSFFNVSVPSWLPMSYALKEFEYKSYYMPEATKREMVIISKLL